MGLPFICLAGGSVSDLGLVVSEGPVDAVQACPLHGTPRLGGGEPTEGGVVHMVARREGEVATCLVVHAATQGSRQVPRVEQRP